MSVSAAAAAAASASPSKEIVRIEPKLPSGALILDAPCGFGRNALYLAKRGHHVVCADHDVSRLEFVKGACPNLHAVHCDLNARGLPFAEERFDALLIVHFIPARWERLLTLLRPGGLLIIETMGGQGENYRELPQSGSLRTVLNEKFDCESYHERHVGPALADAVVVKLEARKR